MKTLGLAPEILTRHWVMLSSGIFLALLTTISNR
jgi:hypothetical protein